MLIHALGGLLEMHFDDFVLIIVLTLYEDWMPFLLAIVFVLIHHGVYGTIDPKSGVRSSRRMARTRGSGRRSMRSSSPRPVARRWPRGG